MINPKQMFYRVSLGILAIALLFSSYNIKAQEENEEAERDTLTILSNIRNLLDKSLIELNRGKLY